MTRTMKICRTWNEVDIKRTGVERERKRKFLRGENDEPKTNFFFSFFGFRNFLRFFFCSVIRKPQWLIAWKVNKKTFSLLSLKKNLFLKQRTGNCYTLEN